MGVVLSQAPDLTAAAIGELQGDGLVGILFEGQGGETIMRSKGTFLQIRMQL